MRNLIVLACLTTLLVLTACASEPVNYTLAPLADMPEQVRSADRYVHEAYQFAIANPGALETVPCYCGCGSMGHTDNLACYAQDIALDGTVTYDMHAVTCGICLDITHDVMRMTNEGASAWDIRAYIDASYAHRGPGTDTPLPQRG